MAKTDNFRALVVIIVAGIAAAAGLLVLARPAEAAPPTFGPAVNLTLPDFGNDVTGADLDGDGDKDLAVANVARVSVLPNNGSGNFGQITSRTLTSRNFTAITSADFDGDGDKDLAMPDSNTNVFLVLLNDGSGGFGGTEKIFPARNGPLNITSADFNGDGRPDLAVANLFSDSVSVHLNDGSAGLFPMVSNQVPEYFVGDGPTGVASADLDGDGKPDLAVSNQNSNNVSVLLNDPATPGNFVVGPFSSPSAGTNPQDITIADFDGDGTPDLAVANLIGTNNVSVLLNNGSGGFPSATSYPSGGSNVKGVTSADFDGDGKKDLAVANAGSSNVSVLPNNGSGAFPTPGPFLQVATGPQDLTSEDLNSDGKPDLVTANTATGSGSLSVLRNSTNRPPVADDDAATTNEDAAVVIDVKDGDIDPDGDTLTVTNVTDPARGTAEILTTGPDAGKVRYSPDTDSNGPDSFQYAIGDGKGGTDTATVNVTVDPANDLPTATATPGNLAIDEDAGATTVTLTGADIDGDGTTFEVTDQPDRGTLSPIGDITCQGTAPKTCSADATYAPDADLHGDDSFKFRAKDATTSSDEATVTIVVESVNDPPAISNVSNQTIDEGTDTGEIPFTVSDVDTPAGNLTLTPTSDNQALVPDANIVIGPASPTDGNRTVKVTPVPDGIGTVGITLAVSDGSASATDAFTLTARDATAPETSITSGPSGPTNDNTPSFAFTSSEADSTFQCRLTRQGRTPGVFEPCSPPKDFTTSLPDGAYTFEVKATDPAGNEDSSPASRPFTVDATPPQTTIDSGPPPIATTNSATITFSSNEGDSTFECSLDGATFGGCTSPQNLTRLGQGEHVFRVKATDGFGNIDPTAAVRTWRVDTLKPTIKSPSPTPNSTTTDRTPTISAKVADAQSELTKANIRLRLNGQLQSTFSYNQETDRLSFTPASNLFLGGHMVKIVAKDEAGLSKVRTWSFGVER